MTPQRKKRKKLDLVGHFEIAELAGVSSPAVSNWANRYADWPPTVADLAAGPIYWRADVLAFLDRHPGLRNPRQIAGAKAGAAKRFPAPPTNRTTNPKGTT